jgi:hypothetical protein
MFGVTLINVQLKRNALNSKITIKFLLAIHTFVF